MINPYNVLGISPDASEDEIKKAYKTLSRRYHPDANVNNPNKEQAEEKFKEIQAAYQQIMNEKKNGGYSYGDYSSGRYGNGGYSSYDGNPFGGFGHFGGGFGHSSSNTGTDPEAMRLNAAANYINSRHYKEALNVLSSINNRTAHWYFLSALANNGVGNNVLALDHAKTAASLEPTNIQYRQLVNSLENGSSWYSDRQQNYGDVYTFNSGCCNPCITCLCINTLCGLC